ncbi:hypothetical protein QE152_g24640 [Popillia japonica]|uniref:Uncharacterized protein n=1 Tax=Popillia japonica TaxID=7064 RepID=A0AAW1K5H2_POPJA
MPPEPLLRPTYDHRSAGEDYTLAKQIIQNFIKLTHSSIHAVTGQLTMPVHHPAVEFTCGVAVASSLQVNRRAVLDFKRTDAVDY